MQRQTIFVTLAICGQIVPQPVGPCGNWAAMIDQVVAMHYGTGNGDRGSSRRPSMEWRGVAANVELLFLSACFSVPKDFFAISIDLITLRFFCCCFVCTVIVLQIVK